MRLYVLATMVLATGQVLEVRSSELSNEHDLPAWTRLQAHKILDVRHSDGQIFFFLQKGSARRILTSEKADWGQRGTITDEGFDTRAWLVGRAAHIPERADPRYGFAPRGAVIEDGSQEVPFEILEKRQACSDSAS